MSSSFLLDLALRLHRLVGADIVVGERVVDDLQAHLDRHFVGRRAVFSQQELEDENRNVGADLHLSDEILSDDLAGESRLTLSSSASRAGALLITHSLIITRTGISFGDL